MADEETTPTKPEEELPNKEAPGEEVKGAETKKVEEKVEEAPSTVTKEEHERLLGTERERYGGLDKKLTETKTDYETQMKSLSTELAQAIEAMEVAKSQSFLTKVEEDGGDVNAAKMLVTRETAARVVEQHQKTEKADLARRSTILNEAGKNQQAHDLIKEHELGEDTLEGLLGTSSPDEMENKALKLHLAKSKTEQRPTAKTDQSKGQTKGVDTSKLSATESLGRAMEEHTT